MSRNLRETAKFKSDKQRVKKSGRHDWQKMLNIVGVLMNDQALPAKNRDHKLTGNYAGYSPIYIQNCLKIKITWTTCSYP